MKTASAVALEDVPPRPSSPLEALPRRGMFWLGLLSVLTTGILFAFPRISIQSLRLLDVDGYMRAKRVVDLMGGKNSWFDGWVYGANAPFGHSLHWTRPVDALLVVLSWPFTLFTELREAVFVGSYLFGLLMTVSIFFAVAWAARALVSAGASYLAAAATAFQLGLVAYNAPGHPDHHGLILLLAALLIGHTLRLLQGDSKTLAIRAGVVGGLGLWVATEFLFPLAICLVALLLRWVFVGHGLRSLQVVTASLFAALVVALALERDPKTWLAFQSDRVSAIHLLMAALLAGFSWLYSRVPWGKLFGRFGIAALTGVAAAAILQGLYPGFFLGPVLAIEPSVDRFFDQYITELAPTWRSVGREWAGIAILLGAPLLASIHAVVSWRRCRRGQESSGWALLVIWSVASLSLALASFRYVPMAELLVGIPLAASAQQRLSRRGEKPVAILRPLLILWCLVGYLPLVVVGSAFAGDATLTAASACNLEVIEQELTSNLRRVGSAEPIVLATVPYGPELLWRLPVQVVGSPYHTNVAGIEFTETIFATDNLNVASGMLDARGVSAVVVCEGEAGSVGYTSGNTFYNHLLARGVVPGWAQVPLPAESSFRIYLRS